jgi:hypothetical protein
MLWGDPRVVSLWLMHCLDPHPKPSLRYGFDLCPQRAGRGLKEDHRDTCADTASQRLCCFAQQSV